jgi:lysophospholipase L1-like esterase
MHIVIIKNLLTAILLLLPLPGLAGQIATTAKVLYIGDSHSYGCFGQELDKSLRGLGQSVESIATCGSSTQSWLNSAGHSTSCGYRACSTKGVCTSTKNGSSDSLEKILARNKPSSSPDLVIIALGSNMLKADLQKTMKDVVSLISKTKISGSKCIWIGPPQAALSFISKEAYDYFVERLEAVTTANDCRFVDSKNKTARENLSDPMGLHYNCNHGTKWASKVITEIQPLLSDLNKSSQPNKSNPQFTK